MRTIHFLHSPLIIYCRQFVNNTQRANNSLCSLAPQKNLFLLSFRSLFSSCETRDEVFIERILNFIKKVSSAWLRAERGVGKLQQKGIFSWNGSTSWLWIWRAKLPSVPQACQIDLMSIEFTFNFLLLRNRFHYYDIYFDIISSPAHVKPSFSFLSTIFWCHLFLSLLLVFRSDNKSQLELRRTYYFSDEGRTREKLLILSCGIDCR